jgi:hypothetical protein
MDLPSGVKNRRLTLINSMEGLEEFGASDMSFPVPALALAL